uniref:EGF-like domain-containing protein n=1 Tax=Panagrellus redivivus TaxID=6233 RepID=A0A7E4VCK7_PANRE
MRLCHLSVLFLGAVADEISLLNYLNTNTLQLAANCPPLFYGLNCQIPHCFPEHGRLARRGLYDYYCNCSSGYALGKHCENIDCNYGKLSASTLRCECPYYAGGYYCQWNTFITLGGMFGSISLLFCVASFTKKDDANSQATSANRAQQNQTRSNAPQPPAAPAPAPEIRIVERVVIQKGSDAPPTYKSAVASANPPKYTV